MSAGGRPTKYSAEVLDKAEDYIRNYTSYGDLVPSNAGLACELGVHRDTVQHWANIHPEFSDMLIKLQSVQERRLLSGGLAGDYNSNITKLMLAKHGYSDKLQQDQISSDGSMTPPAKIELVAREITHSYDD